MYLGACLVLAGAALFYQSAQLFGFTGLYVLATHLAVVFYEEPMLRKSFGQDYLTYCQEVRRWRPRL